MFVSSKNYRQKVEAQIIFIKNRQELLQKNIKRGKIGRLFLREILIVNIVDIL